MKILMWIIVAVVLVGGLAWFLSSDESDANNTESENLPEQNPSQITESGSIESDDEVFSEIDNAVEELQ